MYLNQCKSGLKHTYIVLIVPTGDDYGDFMARLEKRWRELEELEYSAAIHSCPLGLLQ